MHMMIKDVLILDDVLQTAVDLSRDVDSSLWACNLALGSLLNKGMSEG